MRESVHHAARRQAAVPPADCQITKAPLYTRHSRLSLPCRLADLRIGLSQEHAKSGFEPANGSQAAKRI
jgi:hypothetical protein